LKYLLNFLNTKNVKKSDLFPHLKCEEDEARILQVMVKSYLNGSSENIVVDVLSELFETDTYAYLEHLPSIKHLLDLGWLVHGDFSQIKINDVSGLEILNSTVSLSVAFLKLLEEGNLELTLPEVTPYDDHLEYLKDQFFRIDLYQKLNNVKHNVTENSPNISRLKSKLTLLETRIDERLKVSETELVVEQLFTDNDFDNKEKIIFLALLKEEYSHEFDSLRDMNTLIDLVSVDDYERIKNRVYLEDSAKMIDNGIIDYDEILTAFGSVGRSFFITEEHLQKIIHPKKEEQKEKLKLEIIIKEQEIFELIEPKTSMDDVVLNEKTKDVIDNLLKQMDTTVIDRLKEWGIKEKREGIDARIILHGPPGTGKTLTAHSLAKSLGKSILSLDSSKILSMYVGESEKNVRKIYDTYKDLSSKTKREPVLLLNEADQF